MLFGTRIGKGFNKEKQFLSFNKEKQFLFFTLNPLKKNEKAKQTCSFLGYLLDR
jgi:hypothetical protein